ncbi:bifunctional cobalt-precorrin-7 (C(5))-methyltransferase/cobalt-precorrin-6B (C(15))-methyltransferase [Streptomyces sp. PKU-MA01144]|uniref:bifunctional cobalt-precorrin-7 (C(5))-methyltransferase/cobalt-precorrin-6B (C(15))-methyltransferase n=1 Tax=Streptomyces sp. PKU-MA01144 TaxID=2729138 RepID=UPI000486F153|nr:bifunctional cobalt-precorrin-7 (C(5))-methyltransferase/cobalt-precorrin-6B (C(15))-methyltransferase [Streptomyces sp. PKU-MA01144]NNJ02832.1 bifunctional cobalt-precorrin-7 (C(5))-methyltransferase/cobalt-precorrin-6B (C(15))-methyltransferase [Streptomyces sp. PKU-MA01144]
MNPDPRPAVSVVGIGADGWDGLPETSRTALRTAEVLVGGPRQLALLPAAECAGERVPWPSPLRPAVPALLAEHAGRRLVVLASGDPMFYGIGRTLTEIAGAGAVHVLPHPSSVSYACARLGWPVEETEVVTLVGRPAAGLGAALHHGRRLLVLSAGPATPAEVAELLTARGFGPSRIRVLEQLGSRGERQVSGTAETWNQPPGDPLNIVAVGCVRAPGALRLGAGPGLPDEAYENDGQLTKRHVRAATLAALAPAPGELLWDVGSGSGSIAIEWMRTHRSCRAVAVERHAERARRIERNAESLGVPGLRVVTAAAPGGLAGLPVPDAVFIGGGLTAPGLLEACWDALPEGGRLVANTVTLESEALLAERYRRHGGELVRLSVAHAVPVGGFTGWRQAMPVTQWSVTKPPAGGPS